MLDVLRSVIQEVNRAGDLNSVLNIIVERVKETMETDVCSVYLVDERDQRLVFMATRGFNQEAVGKVSLGPKEGLVGYVAERAEPLNLEDAQNHPRNILFAEIDEEPFHAFLGVPIIHHRKNLGVLVVQVKESRRFEDEEEAFLITLSAQLAGVIAHAEATGSLLLSDDHRPQARTFKGMQGAPGVASGTAIVSVPEAELHNVPYRRTNDIEGEIELFKAAIRATQQDISDIAKRLEDRLQPEELALFEAYLHMLDDTAISGEVISRIHEGEWAPSALKQVIGKHVANFEEMDDAYLRERGADVRDLGNRVLSNLQSKDTRPQHYPPGTILVSQELTPADLARVPRDRLAGFISIKGSGKSHVAILAEAMGVPTVMGVEDLPIELLDEKPLIIDGFEGVVITYPSEEQEQYYTRIAAEEAALVEGLEVTGDQPCHTIDGHRVRLWVNTGLMTDVARSLDRGAEGVGLYRTEVHFMMNNRFPTEEEQRVIYREHLQAFAPRPVTMRTLDIGGDKALSYFPISEANPFLGWRGIRVTLDHPEIFLAQVRAMIRANEGIDTELRIMLPMVSSTAEIDEAQRLIAQCYREIVEEGAQVEMPDVGVMIEVPAAVYQAKDIIKRVDFLSVGSNDLIQYMLAVDRNNAQVAELYQEFHPAVLHALNHVVKAAHAERKGIGICGEMAGNPSAAVLLMAMGFDVLSMTSTSLLMVKHALSHFEFSYARQMLKKVLDMDNAYLIKNYVDEEMRKAGLGNIVRSRRYS
ncbi:MAG: phosphoenolpyruvate--protein phosphotransferase [Pseudomonadales bacterium]|nr:phosphoenolpyruvate--protein phosphotransferase [Pseudomonadales bacterium]MBO6597348.1 phosphoenolpyruvate--protein phosphotransferase [Pseudomonadales bacterium]MBO6658140.1 phosphoenolpyruvate--protein phosphotransferase [Pseudomonadales bacterium]MBO6703158.1 phosphoenolpyruvate--protein phosphotransferase [Pseudomonadales bacterium]MBO6824082.1 phosphoenolpyruvate--protein phosphotransferase [Pseudomonadales bacterium]